MNECKNCGNSFSTKFNLKRHTKICKEKYRCLLCNREFPKKANLVLHLKNKNHAIEVCTYYDTELKSHEQKLNKMGNELKKYKNKINELENEIKKKKEIINENDSESEELLSVSLQNSTNIIAYLEKHGSNSSIIKPLDDYSKLFKDMNAIEFRNFIANKVYCGIITNFILKSLSSCYKKKTLPEQSILCSDIHRLTFIIKIKLDNNKAGWIIDMDGTRIKELIIDPYLEYIQNRLREYSKICMDEYKNRVLKVYEDKSIDSINKQQKSDKRKTHKKTAKTVEEISISKFDTSIEKGRVAKKIIRLLAHEFYCKNMNK
jgi:hypothetical protein